MIILSIFCVGFFLLSCSNGNDFMDESENLPYLSLSEDVSNLDIDYYNLSENDLNVFGLALGRMNVTESNVEYVTGLTSGKQIHISENLFAVFKKLLEDTNKSNRVRGKR